jgi:DNA-binding PadR family transcriptional regulator
VHKSELVTALAGEVSPATMEQVLDDLEKLRAIEINEENGSIWKNEYLVVKSSAGD